MTVALTQTPVLETGRLRLRAPGAADWPVWLAFTKSERSRFVRAGELDDGQAWRALGHVIGHWVLRGWGNFVFTLKNDDDALGMTGPWCPAGWPERELGWSVWSAESEGRGYAFEAVQAARAHAFAELGWDTAVSYIDPANLRSIALAERLGAVRDQDAMLPAGYGPDEIRVYRHPRPEAS